MRQLRESLKLYWFRTLVIAVGVLLFMVIAASVGLLLGMVIGSIVVGVGLWGIVFEEGDRG